MGVHLSYVANFFSYAIGNPVGFRIIAIVGSVLEILGDIVEKQASIGTQEIPILYTLLFISVRVFLPQKLNMGFVGC